MLIASIDLSDEGRRKVIDDQRKIVQSVVDASDYKKFEGKQIEYHSKELRKYIGPLLDVGNNQHRCASDIDGIVRTAWSLSIKMNASKSQFRVIYPDTGSKFIAATMVPKNFLEETPMSLQLQQIRLKLVISPCITMREDRVTTIVAKNLVSATVLLMK
jgi:hypothetical protein